MACVEGRFFLPRRRCRATLLATAAASSTGTPGRPRTPVSPPRQPRPYPEAPVVVRPVAQVAAGQGGPFGQADEALAGTGDVTVDSSGRMLTYSGMRTTYKVAVARTATPPDIDSIADRLAAAERSTGQQQLSVRDTARGANGRPTVLAPCSPISLLITPPARRW